MKWLPVGLVVVLTTCFTNVAFCDISTQATARIFRIDSQLNGLEPIIETKVDFDQQTASGFVEIEGGTDIGFATARAFASGAHSERRLIGASVSGQSNATRPVSGGSDHFHTGTVSADAQAIVEFTDELLFNFEPSFPGQVRVSGFLYLTGNLSFAVIENGPAIHASADVSVILSGTGLTMATVAADSRGLPSLNQTTGDVHLFSFDVSQGVPKPISFNLRTMGRASINGPLFVVGPGGSAAAGFDATFSNSLDWGGITSVVNALTGEPITNWSVTSKSGFDYSQVFPPVPEPCSLVLALCGIAGCMLRSSRR